MIQNLVWATGYNVVAIPLAAGALYAWGVLLTPALGAVLMAASTVIVAFNARLLRLKAEPKPETKAEPKPEAKSEPKPEAKAEAKPEVKTEPKPEAKAEPKPEAKAEKPSDLTPQIAKRAYEIYEERSRAVQDWEQAEREIRQAEAKGEPQPEAKK
jgi:outer membrane biosynthesis protein TonB